LEDEDDKTTECCGTPAYMAPEVIRAGKADNSPTKLKSQKTMMRRKTIVSEK